MNYNDQMADAALSIMPEGETFGGAAFNRCGSALQPWLTGGSWAEGWNHDHLFTGPDAKKNAKLTLASALIRPRFYIDEGYHRSPGYATGERPINWQWAPSNLDAPDGGRRVGGQIAYGCDSEHFLFGPLFSLASLTESPYIQFPWGLAPAHEAARDICYFVQKSALGMCRPGMWYKTNRASDRTIARLLYALLRTGQMWEYRGNDLNDVQAAIETFLTFQEAGPMMLVKTQTVDPPIPEGTPYWMFVQYVGYGLPVWKWILDTDLPWIPKARIKALIEKMSDLLIHVQLDGATPWSVTADDVAHFYTSPNGDKYTPGYELFAALKVVHSESRAAEILKRHLALPADSERRALERPWFVDAQRNPVTQ